jgi:MFS family permease
LLIFEINIKNFGLEYYSDHAITQTSLVAMPASLIMTPFSGLFIDKFGVRINYRFIAGVTIVTVLVFYLFMDNIWVFYLCVTLFNGSDASMNMLITISTTFIYDHEVGKRLQKYMYCAFAVAGGITVLIHDNTVLQIFG